MYTYIKSNPKSYDPSGLLLVPDPYSNPSTVTNVKHLSFQQYQQYKDQLSLFRMVYTYNAQAYAIAQANHTKPQYYRFTCSSQLSQFNEAMGLVNKLYNVNEVYPYTCLFFLPFPPFCLFLFFIESCF